MKLKTKLGLGLTFLFTVIIIFGTLSIFYITRLSNDSKSIIRNNLESLVYSNNMLKALEDIPLKKESVEVFYANLKSQEENITEPGEQEATSELRKNIKELLNDPSDSSNYIQIRQSIQAINDLNQQAIIRKNNIAKKTAEEAMLWFTITFCVLGIITFTFIINFPSVIAAPIRALNEGIGEIANKNYEKRIHLGQQDEFGDLANAFNSMAQKLNEYENSNLAKLRFEKSRIETIINQMNDGIIGLDVNNNILFLNTVAETLLGLKQEQIIGKYVADIALKNDLMRSLLRNEKVPELKIFADGKESYFNKEMLNVTNNGEMIGNVIILRNITIFHELNEARTNFIATVSHELKTPISSIKMSAHLLNDDRIGTLNKEQHDLLESITDDSERLLKITSELLNIAQVETGQMELHIVNVSPAGIIAAAMDATSAQAKEKNISINVYIQKDIPFIRADADKTTWVLNNLLTNSIKYSFNGSSIDISATAEQGKVIFSVRDNGTGIEEKFIPRLFDRYFQVPGSTEKGSGLGLAISKEFIEAQRGKIWVESKIGYGSAFFFQLPSQ